MIWGNNDEGGDDDDNFQATWPPALSKMIMRTTLLMMLIVDDDDDHWPSHYGNGKLKLTSELFRRVDVDVYDKYSDDDVNLMASHSYSCVTLKGKSTPRVERD